MGVAWLAVTRRRATAEASSQKIERLDDEVLIALRLEFTNSGFFPGSCARRRFLKAWTVKAGAQAVGGFVVNAVLRKIAGALRRALSLPSKDWPTKDRPTHRLARASAHPLWLVERWTERYGFEARGKSCTFDQAVPETAIRIMASNLLSGIPTANLPQRACNLLPAVVGRARRVSCGGRDGVARLCGGAGFDSGRRLANWSHCWWGAERSFLTVALLRAVRLRCWRGATHALRW